MIASRGRRRLVAVSIVALGVGAWTTPQPPAREPSGDRPLRVCLLDRDLPRAERASASGFDLEIARRLAEHLGRPLEPVWSRSGSPFSEIGESEIPLDALAGGDCDFVASVPGLAALGEHDQDLELTRPYYGATFELVRGTISSGPPGVTHLDDLAGEVVAVRQQTVAHFAAQRRGLRWLSAPTTAEVLALVESGQATAALVWGPEAAASGLETVPTWQPPGFLCWNLHLAVRRSDAQLLAALESALEALRADGTVAALAQRWGLTRAPFDEVFDPRTWSAATSR